MKLFLSFEAVKFPEENLIFITQNQYIKYIYDLKCKRWKKYRNAGNAYITIENYQDVGRHEIISAMNGRFPSKETDFMRVCAPSQLSAWDMLKLLEEDYREYMADESIYDSIKRLLEESSICHKSFAGLKELLDNSLALHEANEKVLSEIKELSFSFIGRDIFKKEIGIVDGHDGSSYFWIMPVRVIDYSNTNGLDSVAEMKSAEISIEEDDVYYYLTPFLFKYFDNELEANSKRKGDFWIEDDGSEDWLLVDGFEWYLTHNFYTSDTMRKMLNDIKDTINALSSQRENLYTEELKKKRKYFADEETEEYNANKPNYNDEEIEMLIDFYKRFVYRMEYMLTVGAEKGYDLISVKGP